MTSLALPVAEDEVIAHRSPAGVTIAPDPLLQRVWSEYVEMPGLRLTPAQAQRLWSIDQNVCVRLLDSLVVAKLLVRGADGRYGRASDGASGSSLLRSLSLNAPPRSRHAAQAG